MMLLEHIDRRVLGAIAFVDAVTGARLVEPLEVRGVGVRLRPNRSGLHVVHEADGFGAVTQRFDALPAPMPAAASFVLTVSDPQQRYLARSFTLALPRAATPAGDAQSVLTPITVALYPAASLPAAPAWALLRVRVQVGGDAAHTGLVNVLLRVTPQLSGAATQTAMTDANGEALVAITGVPALLPAAAPGPTPFVADFSARISLVLDAAVIRLAGATAVNFGPPDPDATLQRLQSAQPGVRAVDAADASLSSGHSRRAVIDVTWP